MGRKIHVVKCDRDVQTVLNQNDVEWQECAGSHRKAKLPNNDMIVWHNHGEFGKGLASKLKKALVAAGLLVLLFVLISCWFGDLIAALFFT